MPWTWMADDMAVAPLGSSGALDGDVARLGAGADGDGLLGLVGGAVGLEVVADVPALRGQVEPHRDAARAPMSIWP